MKSSQVQARLQDISLDEALRQLTPLINPVPDHRMQPVETVLEHCLGGRLASTVTAAIDVPLQDTAAVDGYAFHADDLNSEGPTILPVEGHITAGHPASMPLRRGTACRIFTGAAMPEGPDTVAMQEECQIHTTDDQGHPHDCPDSRLQVCLPAGIRRGSNYRQRGENVRKGEVILDQASRIGPSEIGLAAATGCASLPLLPAGQVSLLSMGDEVISLESDTLSQPLGHGMIYDSNRPMLARLLEADGHAVRDCGIAADTLEAVTDRFRQACKGADAVISSGGSSAGDEDHARRAIAALGGEILLWRLTMKPGRPMAVGIIEDVPVFCLPGNPVAAFVCYRLLVAPLLARRLGSTPAPVMRLPLAAGFDHRHKPGRTEYLRVRLQVTPSGSPQMLLHGRPGAGVLSSLTGADGLVEIPADHPHVKKGDMLNFLPFREAGL